MIITKQFGAKKKTSSAKTREAENWPQNAYFPIELIRIPCFVKTLVLPTIYESDSYGSSIKLTWTN